MGPPRVVVEARNRKIRAMLHVLRAQIECEKFEMRMTSVLKSSVLAADGLALDGACPHAGMKCMCKMIQLLNDEGEEEEED